MPSGPGCGYEITYEATWRDYYNTVIPLPSFIIFNYEDFRFEIYSDDTIDLDTLRQNYELRLTASVALTDMNPAYSSTQTVSLIVLNNCLHDEMTVVTGISDYTYYINENTEKGVWDPSINPIPKVMTWLP